MRRRTAFTSGVLLATTLAACGGATEVTDGSNQGPMKLEVYTWLVAGAEVDAFSNLIEELRRRYPRIDMVNQAQDRPADPKNELVLRVQAGNPPDSFQVVVGTDLRAWGERDALESLDSMSAEQGWANVFPKNVLDAASKNGALLGVPLNIERNNTLFYNKAVLQAHGASVPSGVADFFNVAATLKSQGVTPLAVSALSGWTIGAHLFESVLVAEAGPDFVESYLAGQKTADAPEIQTALSDVARMMDYANDDRATTGWGEAVKKMCMGEAAMLFLPDFVRAQFAFAGCAPDQIGYVPMQPQGMPTFVFASIAFPLPKHAPHPASAAAFLEVTGSAEGQRVFNVAKGSIPARIDVPSEGFDPMAQTTMKDFAMPGERIVLGYFAATSFEFQNAVNPALQQFVDPSHAAYKDVAAVLAVLRQSYATIAR